MKPLIRVLEGLVNCVLNSGVEDWGWRERFILTEIMVLVTKSAVFIRGVSC